MSPSRGVLSSLVLVPMLLGGALSGQERPALEGTLAAVGAYIARYEEAVSAVVAEEDYLQVTRGRAMRTRRLRSDVLVMNAGPAGWVSFRDVYEMDGQRVRDRDDRLLKLFLDPLSEPSAQLRRIAEESARFNLNPPGLSASRTINTPMAALLFWRLANQQRSTFRVDGTEEVEGLPCTRLTFTEHASPRLIGTNNDAPARGSACVQPDSGRVVRTELRLRSAHATRGREDLEIIARIVVLYRDVPRLELWLPATMDEFYQFRPDTDVIQGHAEYSGFRQFQVETASGVR